MFLGWKLDDVFPILSSFPNCSIFFRACYLLSRYIKIHMHNNDICHICTLFVCFIFSGMYLHFITYESICAHTYIYIYIFAPICPCTCVCVIVCGRSMHGKGSKSFFLVCTCFQDSLPAKKSKRDTCDSGIVWNIVEYVHFFGKPIFRKIELANHHWSDLWRLRKCLELVTVQIC